MERPDHAQAVAVGVGDRVDGELDAPLAGRIAGHDDHPDVREALRRLLQRRLQLVDRGADHHQIVGLVGLARPGGHRHRGAPAPQQAGGLGLRGPQGGEGVALVVIAVAAGREGPLAVAEPGLEVGFVDRHPPATRSPSASATRSTCRGHVRVAALSSSQPRRSSVNQPGAEPCSRHAHTATPASRPAVQHPAQVGHLVLVPAALGGLETRPFDGQPVVRDPVLGQQREVVGVPGAKPVAVARWRHPPLGLPPRPVGPRGGALALGGGGGGAPPGRCGVHVPDVGAGPRQ